MFDLDCINHLIKLFYYLSYPFFISRSYNSHSREFRIFSYTHRDTIDVEIP